MAGWFKRTWNMTLSATRFSAIAAIDFYHEILSPLVVATAGPACRFEPCCSRYARDAIAEYGVLRGAVMGFRRLGRCRPSGGWGYDPVPHNMHNARSG
jgi:putative membrane protein insertion efficiency factor